MIRLVDMKIHNCEIQRAKYGNHVFIRLTWSPSLASISNPNSQKIHSCARLAQKEFLHYCHRFD